MAVYGWDDVSIFLVSGYDLLQYLVEEIRLPEARAILDEIRPAGQVWPRRLDSKQRDTKQTLAHTNLYDDAVGGPDQLLVALPQGGPVVVSIQGNVAGRKAVCGVLATSSYERAPENEKLLRVKAEHAVHGALGEGTIMHAQTQRTATFNTEGTPVDNGTQGSAITITTSSVANPSTITTAAAHGLVTGDTVLIAGHSGSTPSINGSQVVTVTDATHFTIPVNVTVGGTGGTVTRTNTRRGGRAFFQIPNTTDSPFVLGGYTSFTPDLRHSATGSTFVALATGQAYTARGGEVVEVAGNVNRYLACGGTFNGAGSGPTVSPVIVFQRNF